MLYFCRIKMKFVSNAVHAHKYFGGAEKMRPGARDSITMRKTKTVSK
jgi:hypothetical protein